MTGGGVQKIFSDLKFGPKGIFCGLQKMQGFYFWSQGFFWALYLSSAQINNIMCNLLHIWDFFEYAKNVGNILVDKF